MAQAAGVEHIRALLRAAGRAETVRELPDSTRTAAEAAAALGCDVAQIGKSIIFRAVADDRPVLVVASGAKRIDEARVAAALSDAITPASPSAAWRRSATARRRSHSWTNHSLIWDKSGSPPAARARFSRPPPPSWRPSPAAR